METNLRNTSDEFHKPSNLHKILLWMCVILSGIGLGAKLFDLMLVAGAWGASPPSSLVFFPYGENFPINPGDFFMPLTVLLIICSIGTLISGRKTPFNYRKLLWIPVITTLLISIFTPILFWPIINELYAVKQGVITQNQTELINIIRKWFLLDSIRILFIVIGFISYISAISKTVMIKE